jgi:hypothetical protein
MGRYLHCCWISLLLISRNSSAPRRVDLPSLTTTYNLLPSPSTHLSRQLQFTLTISTTLSMLMAGSQLRKSQKRIKVWYPVESNTYVLRNAHQPTRRQNMIQVTGQCALVGDACRCGRLIVIKGKGENHVSPSTMQALITQWNMSNQLRSNDQLIQIRLCIMRWSQYKSPDKLEHFCRGSFGDKEFNMRFIGAESGSSKKG